MHNVTKRPEDRRFDRLSKEASYPNADARSTFPENRNGTPFRSPSWRSRRLEKKLFSRFRRVESFVRVASSAGKAEGAKRRRRTSPRRRRRTLASRRRETASMKKRQNLRNAKIRSRRTSRLARFRRSVKNASRFCRRGENARFFAFFSRRTARRPFDAGIRTRAEVFPVSRIVVFPDRRLVVRRNFGESSEFLGRTKSLGKE